MQRSVDSRHTPGPSVVLFGEVLADVFPDRHVLGGAPFNVARHLQAFGLHPLLISRLGSDALRGQVLQAMIAYGMDIGGLQEDLTLPSGQVRVHFQPDGGHRFEILPSQAYDYIDTGMAGAATWSAQPDLVYFGTLAQRHPVSRAALAATLRRSMAPRLLDLNLRPPWYDLATLAWSLQQADLLKLNRDELDELAALLDLPGGDMSALAARLLERYGLQQVVVTCGEEGAWHFDAAGRSSCVPAAVAAVVDTVGAGDGFAAVLILGTLQAWPMELCMARASDFAAAVCGLRGAIPADAEFYRPFLRAWCTG